MDFFTHMMIAYLLSFAIGQHTGVTEPQLLFCVIMAMFPDFDVFLFPLSRKYPALGHRVSSHTFFFALVASLVGGTIVQLVWGIPFETMVPWGILGAVSHVLLDTMTTYAIPPFAPFSWRFVSLDVDSPINPVMMVLNGIMIPVMWSFRGDMDFEIYMIVVLGITLFHALFFLAKAALKFRLERLYFPRGSKVKGSRASAAATFWFWQWYVSERVEIDDRTFVVSSKRVHARGKKLRSARFYELNRIPGKIVTPIDNEHKAVAYSIVNVKDKILEMERLELMIATLEKVGRVKGKRNGHGKAYDVFWFKWWNRFTRTNGILVRIYEDGTVEDLGAREVALKGIY